MKRIQLFLCILLLIFVSACKEENKENHALQMKEVMEVHDALMPKMGVIGSLITKLNNSPDSLKNQSVVNELKASHESMMNWMQGFGERFTSEEILKGKALTKKKQEWLDEEQKKVKALEYKMLESIKIAKELLED